MRGIEPVLRGFKSAYNEILIEVSFIIKVLMAVFHYLNKDHFTKQFLTTTDLLTGSTVGGCRFETQSRYENE